MIVTRKVSIYFEDWALITFYVTINADVQKGEEDTYDTPGTDSTVHLDSFRVDAIETDLDNIERDEKSESVFSAMDDVVAQYIGKHWSDYSQGFLKLAEEGIEATLSDKHED